jgi:hypothetical protein
MSSLHCKVCKNNTIFYFNAFVLNKYDVKYYKCQNCSFIQTEDPFWLNEAYTNAITKQDIGLLYRNRIILPILKNIINIFFNNKKLFIDYGGGYGVLVRTMRDFGFNMYRYEKYCDNIFASNFDHIEHNEKYELLTAFELFEHLEDPIQEISKMLTFSDNIFFSTELQPHSNVNQKNWWYVMPETGQHIALYSLDSLKKIAKKFNLNFYSNGKNLHLFTRKKINYIIIKLIFIYKISHLIDNLRCNKKSFLQEDYINMQNNQ